MTAWANDYVGIPYLVNGRDRNGLDCWGLVLLAFKEHRGLALPDWRVSPARDDLGELVQAVSAITRGVLSSVRQGWARRIAAPEPWAIVTTRRRKRPHHVGLMVDASHVLHCSELAGTVCEPMAWFATKHPERSYWRWTGENACPT